MSQSEAAGEWRARALRAALPATMAILATCVLPRLVMLGVSVIDWDESIYALIGQQWVAGNVPHSTVYDHKPIGLYAIFALFFLALGDSIATIRLIPIAFVAATSALLARLAYVTLGRDRWLAGLTAAVYGLLTLANGGLATNTELLVNLFVVLAITFVVSARLDERVSPAGAAAAGASLGMAFQVNFLASLLVIGVAGFYLALLASRGMSQQLVARFFVNGLWMLGGFLAIGMLLMLPVLHFGDVADYVSLRLAYLRDYESITDAGVALRRVSEAIVAYGPFLALALLLGLAAAWGRLPFAGVVDHGASSRDARVTGWLVVCASALAAAFASGRYYQHFFLFSAPALAMLAAAFLRLALPAGRLADFCGVWLVLMALVAASASHDEYQRGIRAHMRMSRSEPADQVAFTARYMAQRLRPGETIYVFDGQPILYFMTRTTPPTRFAFPESHLLAGMAARFGTTPSESVRGILARRPRFVVTSSERKPLYAADASELLQKHLSRYYSAASAIDPGAPSNLYVRTGEGTPARSTP